MDGFGPKHGWTFDVDDAHFEGNSRQPQLQGRGLVLCVLATALSLPSLSPDPHSSGPTSDRRDERSDRRGEGGGRV